MHIVNSCTNGECEGHEVSEILAELYQVGHCCNHPPSSCPIHSIYI